MRLIFARVMAVALMSVMMSTGETDAQTVVSGRLVDERQEPLAFANVVLLSLPDSAFVSGAVSDSAGVFTLQATADNPISMPTATGNGVKRCSTRWSR